MKKLGLQLAGWLLFISGFGFGLLLIRGVFLGVTQGFNTAPNQRLWVVGGYLLSLTLSVYLVVVGRRTLSVAGGTSVSKPRFGWGRIVVGSFFLYGYIAYLFHLMPRSPLGRRFEPANQAQAVGMNVGTILSALVCVSVIFSGIWTGIRSHRTS